MRVLGLSAYFHDAAAALVVDGEIVAAAQEERFTRIKHDAHLPINAARFCLEQANLTSDDLDYVVFYEKPLGKFERIVVTHLRQFPRGVGQFTRAMRTWLGGRLWLRQALMREFRCPPEKLLFSQHHLSHAASTFLCSPFEEAAIVTVDGVGEWATTSVFHGRTVQGRTHIEPLCELHFPHSIGLLYSALTAYLGFEVNEGEYKVMGLAAYGTARFEAEFGELCRFGDDGQLTLNSEYFSFAYDTERGFSSALERLLGPSRAPGAPLEFPAQDEATRRYADIAATLQQLTERYLLTLVSSARRLTGSKHLCLAGGVALNSVANRRIAEEAPFEALFVQPAAGDAGGAIGAALYVSHVLGGDPRMALKHTLLGQSFDPCAIRQFLSDCRVQYESFANDTALDGAVAERLCRGEVGGWFHGRFEWGPRALGARSILADARVPGMRDRVNAKVKFREAFRPFAPAVLSEDVTAWFDVGRGRDGFLLPYMCSVLPATERARREIPAVVHVDGSARVQTVDREHQPRFHALLSTFKRQSGIGVLLNTSMNLKDEPICGSPAEAYGMFARSELDFLVLEDCLVSRRLSQ